MWATWTFRIVFLLTTAATFILAGDADLPAKFVVKIGVYLKALDLTIWSLSRMIGVDEDLSKWKKN